MDKKKFVSATEHPFGQVAPTLPEPGSLLYQLAQVILKTSELREASYVKKPDLEHEIDGKPINIPYGEYSRTHDDCALEAAEGNRVLSDLAWPLVFHGYGETFDWATAVVNQDAKFFTYDESWEVDPDQIAAEIESEA